MAYGKPDWSQAKEEWYDRSPTISGINWEDKGRAPHGTSLRAAYTAPASKKAIIASANGIVTRKTMATTLGVAELRISIGSPTTNEISVVLKMWIILNAIGDQIAQNVGWAGLIEAGGNVWVQTSDDSTGGTIDYVSGVLIVEYDT